jgi:mono/diheme cytochrome c family protein
VIRTFFVGLSLAGILVACGSARRSEPIAGELAIDSNDMAAGQKVWMQNCDACHIGGEGGLGPSLNDKPLPEFAMRTQVREGLGAMPAFDEREITGKQLDDLMLYVQQLRKH